MKNPQIRERGTHCPKREGGDKSEGKLGQGGGKENNTLVDPLLDENQKVKTVFKGGG